MHQKKLYRLQRLNTVETALSFKKKSHKCMKRSTLNFQRVNAPLAFECERLSAVIKAGDKINRSTQRSMDLYIAGGL